MRYDYKNNYQDSRTVSGTKLTPMSQAEASCVLHTMAMVNPLSGTQFREAEDRTATTGCFLTPLAQVSLGYSETGKCYFVSSPSILSLFPISSSKTTVQNILLIVECERM